MKERALLRAMLINVTDKTIKEVQVEKGLKNIYSLIECDRLGLAYLPNGDAVFVDDEGLFGELDFFIHKDLHQPFRGHGLVMGSTKNGDSADVLSTIEDLQRSVHFASTAQIVGSFVNVTARRN